MAEYTVEEAKAQRKCRDCQGPIPRGAKCFCFEEDTDFGKAKRSICESCKAKRDAAG